MKGSEVEETEVEREEGKGGEEIEEEIQTNPPSRPEIDKNPELLNSKFTFRSLAWMRAHTASTFANSEASVKIESTLPPGFSATNSASMRAAASALRPTR